MGSPLRHHARRDLDDPLRAGGGAVGARLARSPARGDGTGEWHVDGNPAPALAGCLDVDLEASAFTNAFPVHRLALDVGEKAEAPAAYVRASDLRIERLEQSYARLPDDGEQSATTTPHPGSATRASSSTTSSGLVLDYPGLAVRVPY